MVNKPKTDTVSIAPPVVVNTPKKDTVIATPPATNTAITQAEVKKEIVPAKKDTIAVKAPTIVSKDFTFVPTDAHYVVVVLDKVDPVYASEARNAFNRYNKEKYFNQNIQLSALQLDDRFHLVLQGPFSDANAAVDYIDKTAPVSKVKNFALVKC